MEHVFGFEQIRLKTVDILVWPNFESISLREKLLVISYVFQMA